MKIKFTHVPAGKLITDLEDSVAIVHFKSNGYNLLDLLLHGSLDSLNINLSECDIKKESGNLYAVNTVSLRENVAKVLGVNDRDLEFSKPVLLFSMERLHKKKLKVSTHLNLSFKSQYKLYGYKIIPSKITVYGPQQILESLKLLGTEPVHLENLDNDKKVKVKVLNPYPEMLKLRPDEVSIDLNVEKYTERRIEVPINLSGINPKIRTFPTSVAVSFNIFIKDYEKIHQSQFKIIPDVRNIDLRKVKTLRLRLVSFPKEIGNIRIIPPEVEFIIVN